MNIDEQPSSIDQETSLPPVPVRPPTPENCAVCLNNKQADVIARIDSCVHTFCFPCVLEWSKVRAICPLCKQPFTVITRERYSGELIEEIRVAPTQAQAPNHFSDLNDVLNWVDRNHTRRADNADGQERNSIFRQMVYIEWLNTVQSIARRPEHARSNPLGNSARSARLAARTRPEWTTPSANQISLNSIRRLIDRYMRQSSSDRRESTVYSQSTRQTVAFRKHIYLNRLYVQSPLVGHNGNTISVRECSPTWYAANRACLHRLIPFLGRELLALLWNDAATIERVIHEILTTIQLHDIRSRRLARKLNEYLGQYTKHFVHEFYTFARCPYDLAGFDRHAQYPTANSTASAEAPVQISLDDEQDGNAHEPIVLDETVDSSSSASSSPAMIELDERSTSPECEIVEYVEPSGERTPTLIVLSEDEDADVMHDPPSQTARSTKRKQRRSPQRSKKQQTTTVSSLHSATNDDVDGHDATEEQTLAVSGDR